MASFFSFWIGITVFISVLFLPQAANLLTTGSYEKKKQHKKRTLVLKVAMVCPLDEERFAANAADAAAGWEVWLNKTKGMIKLEDKKSLKVQSTTISYSNKTLIQAIQKVSAGKFHLVVGCSTHYFGEVVAALQVIKVPSLQCNAGNPTVWTKLAGMAKEDKVKLYGYGMHAPFTNYPLAYLKMAQQAFHMQEQMKSDGQAKEAANLYSNFAKPLKVALVQGQTNQFTKELCSAAKKAAFYLKMKVISGESGSPYINYEDISEAAKQADILYGCTLLKDGMEMMRQIAELKPSERPRAVSISVAPSKEESFLDEFGKQAAYVSYPSQWHTDVDYSCDPADEDDDYRCPSTFSSTQSYLENFKESTPSYDKASCSAAGVALEVAAKSLSADFSKLSLQEQRDSLHEALGDVETDSFFGSIEFDEETHMNSGLDVAIAQYQPTGDLGKMRSFAVTNKTFALALAPPSVTPEVPKSAAATAGISIMFVLVLRLLSF